MLTAHRGSSLGSSQSLSPAPSSTERKSKPLPQIILNVKQAQDQSAASSRDSEAESDLGSITDSNEDEGDTGPPAPSGLGQELDASEAEPDVNGVAEKMNSRLTDGGEEDEVEVDGEDDEEEEDGDGDVTMRAIDGLQALAQEATQLPNGQDDAIGDDRPTDDPSEIEIDPAAPVEHADTLEEGETEEQADPEDTSVPDEEQENGGGEEEEDEEEAARECLYLSRAV